MALTGPTTHSGTLAGASATYSRSPGNRWSPDRIPAVLDLVHTHPGDCPDGISCPGMRRHQLPARSVLKIDPHLSKCQPPARTGRQEDWMYRDLFGEAERVGQHPAGRNDRLSPQIFQGVDQPVDLRGARAQIWSGPATRISPGRASSAYRFWQAWTVPGRSHPCSPAPGTSERTVEIPRAGFRRDS